MSLLTLPTEVLGIILKKLDTKSLYNLHEACCYLRNVICMPGVVKELQFSLNTLATVKSFQSDFFRDVSGHLKILDLSGVPDLTKTSLLPALRKLKNLIELDVSYTNILMLDLFDIIKMRPTLKSLSINFTFSKMCKITKSLLLKYQLAFEGLEKVHFVGSTSNLVYGNTAISMLKKADLSSLQFTLCGTEYYGSIHSDEIELDSSVLLARLSVFKIYSLTNICYDSVLELPVLKLLNLENYEILIFQKYNFTLVHATPLLKEFICKNFDVEVNRLSDLASVVVGHVAIMLWHREYTQFDDTFYSNLLTILKEYLVFRVSRFDSTHCDPVPGKYNWYCAEQCIPATESNDLHDEVRKFKKARLAQQSLILNYDEAFRDKKKYINFEINFKEPFSRPVTISSCDLFKKISHLSLVGNVQYTSDFFKNLFEKCDYLVTLVIIKPRGNFSVPTLLNYLPKSKVLKNLLIHVSMLHYFPLFTYLSECKNLENVHLVNSSAPVNTLPNPSDLFIKCENLYSICIRCDMPNRLKILKFYKKVRSKLGKNYLNVDIIPFTDEDRGSLYDPYFSVFNVYQLKPM